MVATANFGATLAFAAALIGAAASASLAQDTSERTTLSMVESVNDACTDLNTDAGLQACTLTLHGEMTSIFNLWTNDLIAFRNANITGNDRAPGRLVRAYNAHVNDYDAKCREALGQTDFATFRDLAEHLHEEGLLCIDAIEEGVRDLPVTGRINQLDTVVMRNLLTQFGYELGVSEPEPTIFRN